MMKGNAPKLKNKARKLLLLYSLWHETHKEEFQRKYLHLLAEILRLDPSFKMHRELERVLSAS